MARRVDRQADCRNVCGVWRASVSINANGLYWNVASKKWPRPSFLKRIGVFMRHLVRFNAILRAVALLVLVTAVMTSNLEAQQSIGALERGYRTGYSDGYIAGYRDNADHAPHDYRDNEDYRKADRAYVETYGPLEDYQDGYKQGFETGYDAGYEKRGFDSGVPAGIERRGAISSDADTDVSVSTSGPTSGPTSGTGRVSIRTEVIIPTDTVMIVELLSDLSTQASQQGDSFQARVLGPAEYEGALIDGRVTRVKRPGKVKGTAELQLTFDHIRLLDNRSADMSAQVIEVIDMGNQGTGSVDSEGGVKGKDSTSSDVKKVGVATGIGAIIGAIAGGGKGAAIGAAIGGAVGTGGVLATRGSELRLPQGQQLRIRTSAETRIR
jgi:hypothetical protein